MKKFFLLTITSMLLIACAGTDFNWDNARKIKVGMTEQEVTALLGHPYMTTSRSDELIYVWSHSNGMTGSTKAVSVIFKDGKVVSSPTIPEFYN